jgi:hypothetical protein
MAQTNFTPILTYKSDTATVVPSAGNLTNSANGAELAVNTADKRLFTKDSGGNVVELGTNPSSVTLPNGTANGVVFANGSKVLTTGSALTFDGSFLNLTGYQYIDGTTGDFLRFRGSTVGVSGGVSASVGYFGTYTNHPFAFQISNTEQMRLTSTGLGIGTSSPATALHVASGNFRLTNGAGFSTANTLIREINAAAGASNQFVTSAIGFRTGAFSDEGIITFSTALNASTPTERMRLSQAGNLGIGTSSPSNVTNKTTLTLNNATWGGRYEVAVGGTVKGAFDWGTGDTVNLAAVGAAVPLTFVVNASERMRINASGNVGIGITAPLAKLHVSGGGLLVNGTLSNINQGGISLDFDGVGNVGRVVTSNASSNAMAFYVGASSNATEMMRLDSSGNLGIGTSSPGAKLDVAVATGAEATSQVKSGTAFGRFFFRDSDNNFGIYISDASGAQTKLRIKGSTGDMIINESGGNVGIGTSSPVASLQVGNASGLRQVTISGGGYDLILGASGGSIFGFTSQAISTVFNTAAVPLGVGTSGSQPLILGTANTERMRLDSSGNLGIGTSSPIAGYRTTTVGSSAWITAGANFTIEPDAASGANGVDLKASFSAGGNGPLKFWTANTERMRLDSSGNLGIGTSSSVVFVDNGGTQANPRLLSAISSTNTTRTSQAPALTLLNSSSTLTAGRMARLSFAAVSSGIGSPIHSADITAVFTSGATGNGVSSNLIFSTTDNTVTQEPQERMRIDASGNLGIGTSSPSNKLDVSTDAVIRAGTGGTPSTGGALWLTTGASTGGVRSAGIRAVSMGESNSHDLVFLTNGDSASPTERARIDSSGNLLIGTTSNTEASRLFVRYPLATSGGAAVIGTEVDSTVTLRAIAFHNPNGLVGTISTSGSGTAFNTSSDYRLKNTIAPMTGALAKVALLKPCTYKWNADGSDGEGFIAHELAEVVPQCVTGEKDAVDAEGKPRYQGIDTSFLVATLTAAIQEQQAIINSLKARLDAANL